MTELKTIQIPVEPFTAEAFAPFGAVITQPGGPANFEGNRSHSWILPFEAEGATQLMFSRFYHQTMTFTVLERHFNVTQGFMPLHGTPLVMVVAPRTGREGPDTIPAPEALRAFYMDGSAGLIMHAGTWHTLDRYPVAPPHVDCLFFTAKETQDELIREKADGTAPTQTEVFDYKKNSGIVFEVTGYDKYKSN
jgi:ureidoglycolate hydrolase